MQSEMKSVYAWLPRRCAKLDECWLRTEFAIVCSPKDFVVKGMKECASV